MAAGDILLGATRTSSNLTITLASLATDANLLAGRISTLVDNTTNKYPDYILAGFITAHASVAPTVGTTIEIWLYGSEDDSYTLPDGIGVSDANKTLTSTYTKNSGLVLAHIITVSAVAAVKYDIRPLSIRNAFGGILPKKFGVYVVQNTGQALNATGSNHQLTITPDYVCVSS